MNQTKKRPVLFFYFLVLSIFFILIARIFFLQVIRGEKFKELATLNYVRIIPEQAPRGEIFDRNYKILATSRPVFSVFLYPTGKESPKMIKRLANILKIKEEEIIEKIKENTSKQFSPILLKKRLDFQDITLLEEEKFQLPGIIIQKIATRFYPEGKTLAHVLGYVSSISQEEIQKLKKEKKSYPYSLNDLIGKDGIELKYEEMLRGKHGGQQIAVDATGRLLQVLENIPSEVGSSIVLTIDVELQKVAEKAMEGKKGAVVVLDTKTGEILTLVSHPAYNPNMFSEPISPNYWNLQKKLGYPFFNRAINGYPPGSVFKLITALAGLETGKLKKEDTFYCPGFFKLGQRIALCWEKHGHGWVDLMKAIVVSCDVAFYNIGLKLGPEIIAEMGKKFGFGLKTGIELPGESPGIMPDPDWKKKKYNEIWFAGDSINLAIGQGFIQTTPLQVALFMEALANNGTYYVPTLVKEVFLKENKKNAKHKKEIKILGQVNISPENLQFIKESLREVVKIGTGQAALLKEIAIAGKTGTAEDPPRYPPHAWFACFAPYENPEVALAVFVEQGGHGGAVAAPIAREIIEWWYNNRILEKNK